MRIAIIYNRDSQAVINLFGTLSREKYGLETINLIASALEVGGHRVKAFEGDKNIVYALEDFMPSVVSGERPGLVFNLSYGIQGRARYTHIPGILEMLGIPYVGSGPETHAVALDKVLTKMILLQKGLPTPQFTVVDSPAADLKLDTKLKYPLIIKPRAEAGSLGLKIVHSEEELRQGVAGVYEMFRSPVLIEEYIEGREFNVGLLGNNPPEAFFPLEIIFSEGERIFTHEDKKNTSGRKLVKACPAEIDPATTGRLQQLAVEAFAALGCSDIARVDFRLDQWGNPYILEINSMASLEPSSSYVYAAKKMGFDYTTLVNRLIDEASNRYFGPSAQDGAANTYQPDPSSTVFNYLTRNRDVIEDELKRWTDLPSWTGDPLGLGAVMMQLEQRLNELGLIPVTELFKPGVAWTWQTPSGYAGGTLLLVPVDIPRNGGGGYPTRFRREPQWLYGEGIASSRAPMIMALQALEALQKAGKLQDNHLGVFFYADEGRGMRYSGPVLEQASGRAGQVIDLQPGFGSGMINDRSRGSLKLSVKVEGNCRIIGTNQASIDTLSWFIQRANRISLPGQYDKEMVAVAIQDLHSERHSKLLPHRLHSVFQVTYTSAHLADRVERELQRLFSPSGDEEEQIAVYIEKIEERPPLNPSTASAAIIENLKEISRHWRLPFGVEPGLLPTAAGLVPPDIPAIGGFGPSSRQLFSPRECIHRGELLERLLLLSLYLAAT